MMVCANRKYQISQDWHQTDHDHGAKTGLHLVQFQSVFNPEDLLAQVE